MNNATMLAQIHNAGDVGTWYTFASTLTQSVSTLPVVEIMYISSEGKAYVVPLSFAGYKVDQHMAANLAITRFETAEDKKAAEAGLIAALVPFNDYLADLRAGLAKLTEDAAEETPRGMYL